VTVVDGPDWERIVTTVAVTGDVPDAPDWERIVVGSGGTPVGLPTAGFGYASIFLAAGIVGVTLDGISQGNTTSILTGAVNLMAFTAMATKTVSTLWVPVTGSTTYTAGTTFGGLYDFGQASAGNFTLLAQSASGAAATAWATAGMTQLTISPSTKLTAGQQYALAVVVGGNSLPVQGNTLGGGIPVTPNYSSAPLQAIYGSHTSLPSTLSFASAGHPGRFFLAYIS
jgi:hypothetical protein